jgi:hypothetical protein
MPVGSIGSHREVLDVNDLNALERPHRPLVQLAPVPAQERSMAVAPPPPWVPQPPPANLPSQAAAPQAAPQSGVPQSANAAPDLASMPGLLNLTGGVGSDGGAAALFADADSGGASAAVQALTPATAAEEPVVVTEDADLGNRLAAFEAARAGYEQRHSYLNNWRVIHPTINGSMLTNDMNGMLEYIAEWDLAHLVEPRWEDFLMAEDPFGAQSGGDEHLRFGDYFSGPGEAITVPDSGSGSTAATSTVDDEVELDFDGVYADLDHAGNADGGSTEPDTPVAPTREDVQQVVVAGRPLATDIDGNQLEIDANGSGFLHLKEGGIVVLGVMDPVFAAQLGGDRTFDGSFLSSVGTANGLPLGQALFGGLHATPVPHPASGTSNAPSDIQLRLPLGPAALVTFFATSAGNGPTSYAAVVPISANERYVVAIDQLYGRIERLDEQGAWQVTLAGVEYAPAGIDQRYIREMGQSHGQLQQIDEHGEWQTVREHVRAYAIDGSQFAILTDEESARLRDPLINLPESPGPGGAPGYVADVRDTSTPGYGVIDVPPATSTTTPIAEQSWTDLIVESGAPGTSDFVGPVRPSNWDALTSHPDAHAFSVHGGAVTDAQLITRALTGVKPDGSTGPIPPFSSAFYSDELLIATDLAIRNGGGLQNAIARQPGQSTVIVEAQDVGDLGLSAGYGYSRIGATGNRQFNGSAVGPLQRVDNLNSAEGVYEFNPIKGVWETITVYPAKW